MLPGLTSLCALLFLCILCIVFCCKGKTIKFQFNSINHQRYAECVSVVVAQTLVLIVYFFLRLFFLFYIYGVFYRTDCVLIALIIL